MNAFDDWIDSLNLEFHDEMPGEIPGQNAVEPGMVFKYHPEYVENGARYCLVGDINGLLGACDCCKGESLGHMESWAWLPFRKC